MALGLQGVVYHYLKNSQIQAMMEDCVIPARDVTVDILASWMTDLGFIPPEVEEEESEDYKLLAQIVHVKKPDGRKKDKEYTLRLKDSNTRAPRSYSMADQNGRVVIMRYHLQ
jgi:hypothetical protein